jgi:hypothetical protein
MRATKDIAGLIVLALLVLTVIPIGIVCMALFTIADFIVRIFSKPEVKRDRN